MKTHILICDDEWLIRDTLAQVALTVRVGALECLPDEAAARLCAASLA